MNPIKEPITSTAISLIPSRIEQFLENTSSISMRAKLFQRHLGMLGKQISSDEIVKSSIIRLFAFSLLREAGSKATNFQKTDEYNKAKLSVRAAIVRYIAQHPTTEKQFNNIALRKQRRIGKINRILNRLTRKKR